MRILGIDPGLRLTGYGVIDYKSLRPSLVDGGVIRLKTKTTIADRLVELETELQSLFDEYKPDVCGRRTALLSLCPPAHCDPHGPCPGVIMLVARRSGAIVEQFAAIASSNRSPAMATPPSSKCNGRSSRCGTSRSLRNPAASPDARLACLQHTLLRHGAKERGDLYGRNGSDYRANSIG